MDKARLLKAIAGGSGINLMFSMIYWIPWLVGISVTVFAISLGSLLKWF